MSIIASDLKWYRSAVVTNTVANGGRMSNSQIVSNVRNNLFPDVKEAERAAGITRYRKLFLKVANADSLTLYNGIIYMGSITPAEDYVSFFAGTQTDTQNDITSPREYGAGFLSSVLEAGTSVFDVMLESDSLVVFYNGDTICISDGTNEEYHHNVSISKTGDVVTITLDAGDQISNTFDIGETVSSCIDCGDVKGSFDNWDISSASGVFDIGEYPVIVNSIGGVFDTWTLSFTSSSAFDCVGSVVGSVTSGNTSTSFSPLNSNFSDPYFTLNNLGFGGTWSTGDTIIFRTIPAAIPVWFKQVVPENASSYSGNSFSFKAAGESA